MEVRKTGAAGARQVRDAAAQASRAPASSAAPGAAGQPLDVATIAGIPTSELTPAVSAALERLLAEVHHLREALTQAQKRIDHLQELADRDPLAPVLNRRAFVRELARMIAYAERYQASSSVLYFDVDNMKQINDEHGHAAGDVVLTAVAEILLGGVRASDVVGRLGGDEFGVILAQADPEIAAAKAVALAAAVEANPVLWNGAAVRARLSYGSHTFTPGEGADQALSAADRAMYAYKRGPA